MCSELFGPGSSAYIDLIRMCAELKIRYVDQLCFGLDINEDLNIAQKPYWDLKPCPKYSLSRGSVFHVLLWSLILCTYCLGTRARGRRTASIPLVDQLQCHKLTRIKSAIDALDRHGLGLQTLHLPDHNVNYAGHLVIDTFGPECWVFTPLLSSTPDPKGLASTFKDQPLTRSLLVEYYDLLKLVCLLYTERSTTNHVSITRKGITTKLCPPLPYVARSPWGSQQTLVKIAWISNMLRWTIPISQPLRWPIMQEMVIEVQTQKSSGHSSSPLFHVLASQIHHVIGTMKTDASGVKTAVPYYMEFYCEEIKPSTPLPYDSLYLWHVLDDPDRKNHWWSTDPEGQIPISTTVVEGASDVCFFANIYPILWDIHKACGFDPDSTEMAEYLGYPLLELKGVFYFSRHYDTLRLVLADSESVLHEFGPSQESDQPSHSGYESEVESDDVSSSSHETFVSALSED
ncbi:hypothetical protein C8J56DRAFT_1126780 [Mycena floridula]|nr:hypothetical protein C8J56DRAFT_1126780 [Mycena floridula]